MNRNIIYNRNIREYLWIRQQTFLTQKLTGIEQCSLGGRKNYNRKNRVKKSDNSLYYSKFQIIYIRPINNTSYFTRRK